MMLEIDEDVLLRDGTSDNADDAPDNTPDRPVLSAPASKASRERTRQLNQLFQVRPSNQTN